VRERDFACVTILIAWCTVPLVAIGCGPSIKNVSASDQAKAKAAAAAHSHGPVTKIACGSTHGLAGCSVFAERGRSGRCDDWAVYFQPHGPMQIEHVATFKC